MAFVLRPPGETPPLVQQLATLGQSRRSLRLGTGLARMAALFPLALAVICWLDAQWHLPAGLRAVLLAALVTGLILAFFLWVRKPLREPVTPQHVAHLLEAQYPRMNDALASAVAFQEATDTPDDGTSQRFRTIATIRAQNLAERHDLEAILPSGRFWKFLGLSLLSLIATAIIASINSPNNAFALQRLIDPYGAHSWPAQTIITLIEPAKTPVLLAKGEAFPLTFRVSGVIPEAAQLQIRHEGTAPSIEWIPLPVEETQANGLETKKVLDPSRVSRNFAFRIIANDADTQWQEVQVVPAPRLVPRDGRPSPQIELTPRRYTHLPVTSLPDGTSVVEAIAGTDVSLRAAADRRIIHAAMVYQGDVSTLAPAQAVAGLAGIGSPYWLPLFTQELAQEVSREIPVQVQGAEGTLLDVRFVPRTPGLYALQFTDEAGLTGTRLFDIRMYPDPSPTVALERPAAGQDALTLLPSGSFTMRVRAEDRIFAVRDLHLQYRVNNSPWSTVPLADFPQMQQSMPAVAGSNTHPSLSATAVAQHESVYAVARFLKPDGTAPGDGDTLTLKAVATDWDDYTLLKPPGESHEVTLRIFAPASFDALIQKQLASLRPEVARLQTDHEQTQQQLQNLLKDLPKDEPLRPEQRANINQLEQQEKQLANTVGDPRDGLRTKAEEIENLIASNGLPPTPVTQRAGAIARELKRLDQEQVPELVGQLGRAKLAADTPPHRPDEARNELTQAARRQQAVTDTLKNLMEQLERWSGAGEIKGDARALQDQVAKAREQVQEAKKEIPSGTPADQLTEAERQALDRTAEKIERAGNDASAMLGKAGRIAAEKAQLAKELNQRADQLEQAAEEAAAVAKAASAGSPEQMAAQMRAATARSEAQEARDAAQRAQAEAEALQNAVQQSGGQAMADDLRKAANELRQNRSANAESALASAQQRLDTLKDELSEGSSEAVDQLRKKSKTDPREIEALAEGHDELRKKIKNAGAEPDAERQAEQLQQLAQEQELLKMQAEQLARKLERNGDSPTAEQLRRAAEQMEQQRETLERGDAPTPEQQQETEERLQQAREQLQQEQQKDEQSLLREQGEQFLQEFRALVERQKAAVAEAERIEARALQAKRWERPLLASLTTLADQQSNLAEDVLKFAESKLEDTRVFDRMVREAAAQMQRATITLNNRKDDALLSDPDAFDEETEKLAGEVARKPMVRALRRLEQVLKAISPEEKPKPEQNAEAPPMPMEGGEGGAGPMPPPGGAQGLPPIAQLKALREWQAELNERTIEFAKQHPDPSQLTEDELEDLKEIERGQKHIAELLEHLLEQFQTRTPEIP